MFQTVAITDMEEFFELYMTSEEAPQSAFQRYRNVSFDQYHGVAYHGMNANKRMVEFLKRSWPENETKKEKGVKHKMTERMRREKQKQFYMALHELLPLGTKSDKNSILEMAVKEIRKVKEYKEELCKKNKEMEMMILSSFGHEKAEIKVEVDHPASGLHSMVELLTCLKTTGSVATSIQSHLSHHQLVAQIEFETKMRAEDVERAVQRTLLEAEMKFRHRL